MSEFHVEVIRVGRVEPHPNAGHSDPAIRCDNLSITHVHGEWASLVTTVMTADLQVFPSTVTAGGIRVLHATTMANVPIFFRAEGR